VGSRVVAAGHGTAARADLAHPSTVVRAADIAADRNATDRAHPAGRIDPGRMCRAGHGGASASAAGAVAAAAGAVAAGTLAVATHPAATIGRSDHDAAGRREAVHSTEAGRPTGSVTDPGHGRRSAGSGPMPPDRPATAAATRLDPVAAPATDRGTAPHRPGRAGGAAVPIARPRIDPAAVPDPVDRAASVSRAPDSGPPSRGSSDLDPVTASRPTTPAPIGPVASAATTRHDSRIAGPATVRRSDRHPDHRPSIAPVRRIAARPGLGALRSATGPAAIARGGMPRPGRRTRIDRGSRLRTC
jgi:hypothetical protein